MIYIYLTVWVWSESSFHVDVNWQTLAYLIIFTDSIININLSIFTDSIINPSWTEHITDSSLGSGSKNWLFVYFPDCSLLHHQTSGAEAV